jgi:deoxyribodipyrimidine photolyase-related protein
MSNFCKDCYYDVKEMTGQKACPFNALYWNFMAQNREKLETNPRLGFMYKTWDRFSEEKKDAIILRSIDILKMMNEGLL